VRELSETLLQERSVRTNELKKRDSAYAVTLEAETDAFESVLASHDANQLSRETGLLSRLHACQQELAQTKVMTG